MFPHVKGRPLSLVCCPSGVGGERFFRRHLDGKFEGVGFFSGHGERENFFLKQERGIVALAQYNAVEFHVRGGKGDRCDVMVFDLDPDEGLPLADTVRGARLLRDVLSGLGLVSFLKTSGGKGYHLTVPFRAIEAEKFREFAKSVALLMENAYPTLFTANISKRAREGKIFLDWQRNTSGATSVAPYSLRARDRATVSMPISWRELSRVAPDGVTLRDALKRLEKKDPWADYFTVKSTQVLKIKR